MIDRTFLMANILNLVLPFLIFITSRMKEAKPLPIMLAMALFLSMMADAQFYFPPKSVELYPWRGAFGQMDVSQEIPLKINNNYCSNVCNADPICIVNCIYFTSGVNQQIPSNPLPPLPATPTTSSTTPPVTPTTTPAPTTTTSPPPTPSTTTATTTTTPVTTTTIPPPTPPPNPNVNVTTCEGKTLSIICPSSPSQQTITVLEARYGRYAANVCPGENQQNTNCDRDVSENVRNFCNGKPNCAFVANNGRFGDPCGGTYKYLKMTYRCA